MSWKSISDKTIRERQPNKWLRCEEGELALVPREPMIKNNLGASAIELLDMLVKKFKPGQIFSLKELDTNPDRRNVRLIYAMNRLWRFGYLDKYALGEWGGGWRGKYAGTAGKYWGVHYMLTEKVNEISRRSR